MVSIFKESSFVLLPFAAIIGGIGGVLLWLGLDEDVEVVIGIGMSLVALALVAVFIAVFRGIVAIVKKSGELAQVYRQRRTVLRPVVLTLAAIFGLISMLAAHNYVVWRGVERDCEFALKTHDAVEGERALWRGIDTMDNPLLLIPSSLFDLWGPNRCRSACKRYGVKMPAR